ncbi:tetratricopeptide repeat protein [Falsiruegeria litorea]|uniref:tetratricopeptide repeat protein n=1 Tax=Falsiruegeria litorea TaxID=1280831 RepID=UPI0013FD4162|nr:tetratricopeptide repeat protein [Falsiruegeria litorea]
MAFAFGLVRELLRPSVVIGEITTPKVLRERGLDGNALGRKLADALEEIRRDANSSKDALSFLPAESTAEIQVPGAEFSLNSVVDALRQMLGLASYRITGELVCGDTSCTLENSLLTLRVRDGARVQSLDAAKVGDQGIEAAMLTQSVALTGLVEPYLAAAYAYFQADADQEKLEVAEAAAMNILREGHPDSAWAANLIGLVRHKQQRFAEAVTWFERSARLSYEMGPSSFALPHSNRGNSLLHLSKPGEAQQAFYVATLRNPYHETAYAGQGRALAMKQEHGMAISFYKRQLRMNPRDFGTMLNVSHSLNQMGQRDEALTYLNTATELAPNDALVYHHWGNYYAMTSTASEQNLREALRNYEKAIELSPEFTPSRKMRVWLLISLGESQQAFETLHRTSGEGHTWTNADVMVALQMASRNLPQDPKTTCVLLRREVIRYDTRFSDTVAGQAPEWHREVEAFCIAQGFL